MDLNQAMHVPDQYLVISHIYLLQSLIKEIGLQWQGDMSEIGWGSSRLKLRHLNS